jgi:hypothetical protein
LRTKLYQKFFNRLAHYEADLELSDVLSFAASNHRLYSSRSTQLFDYVDTVRHPRLSRRASLLRIGELLLVISGLLFMPHFLKIYMKT